MRVFITGASGHIASAVIPELLTARSCRNRPGPLRPGHHQPRSATLTAWTVSRAADGTVIVTIRDFRNPTGLQRNLAAAGIPALVQVTAGQCPYPYQAIPGNASVIGRAVSRDPRTPGSDAVFTIHPDAIPAGTQLDIFFPSAGHRIAKPAPPQAPPTAARQLAFRKRRAGRASDRDPPHPRQPATMRQALTRVIPQLEQHGERWRWQPSGPTRTAPCPWQRPAPGGRTARPGIAPGRHAGGGDISQQNPRSAKRREPPGINYL